MVYRISANLPLLRWVNPATGGRFDLLAHGNQGYLVSAEVIQTLLALAGFEPDAEPYRGMDEDEFVAARSIGVLGSNRFWPAIAKHAQERGLERVSSGSAS